jgi:gluconate 2-dehydrogenase gamma chain
MSQHVNRRDFVALVGAVLAAESIETRRGDAATSVPDPAPALGSEREAYTYLTAPEATFVEAAVDRLIPLDTLSPGGREAGVAFYIDQQLSGQFGYAAKMYRQGPWVADACTPSYTNTSKTQDHWHSLCPPVPGTKTSARCL